MDLSISSSGRERPRKPQVEERAAQLRHDPTTTEPTREEVQPGTRKLNRDSRWDQGVVDRPYLAPTLENIRETQDLLFPPEEDKVLARQALERGTLEVEPLWLVVEQTLANPIKDSTWVGYQRDVARLQREYPHDTLLDALHTVATQYERGKLDQRTFYNYRAATLKVMCRQAQDANRELEQLGSFAPWHPAAERLIEAEAILREFPPDPGGRRISLIRRAIARGDLDFKAFPLERIPQRPEQTKQRRQRKTTAKRRLLTKLNKRFGADWDRSFWTACEGMARKETRTRKQLGWVAANMLGGARPSQLLKGVDVFLAVADGVGRPRPADLRRDKKEDIVLALAFRGSKVRDGDSPRVRCGQPEHGMFIENPTAKAHPGYVGFLYRLALEGHKQGLLAVKVSPDFPLPRHRQHPWTELEVTDRMRKLYRRIAKEAGLSTEITPSLFRHRRSATDKADDTLSRDDVSMILGHRGEQTIQHYGVRHQAMTGSRAPKASGSWATHPVRRSAPKGPAPGYRR